jgi:hypothetical protein
LGLQLEQVLQVEGVTFGHVPVLQAVTFWHVAPEQVALGQVDKPQLEQVDLEPEQAAEAVDTVKNSISITKRAKVIFFAIM